jgi:hypothetical protein
MRWLVGEDDYFLPARWRGQVAEVSSASNPFVLCNYALVEDSSAAQARPALDVSVDTTVTADELIRRYLWSAGFMGACLFDFGAGAASRAIATRHVLRARRAHRRDAGSPDRPVRILGAPWWRIAPRVPEAFTWRPTRSGSSSASSGCARSPRRLCRR